jgi:hypothetical protein
MSGVSFNGIPRRLVALFCALGMACSAYGILPAVVTVVGSFDSDHRVVVTSSGQQMEVRFHHAEENHTNSSGDDAAPSANSPDSHRDHVVRFASTGDLLSQISSAPTFTSITAFIAVFEAREKTPIVRSYVAVSHARPPPGETSLIHCLRSVVLLV